MSQIYIKEPATNGKVLDIFRMLAKLFLLVPYWWASIRSTYSFPQVLLKTTVGDIDIELWSKETPLACRNFVQLCLEGYYNGCMFHRIIQGRFNISLITQIIEFFISFHELSDFIAQTGDPTNTGEGT